MSATETAPEIDRATVLGYTSRINWEAYLGQGKGPGGALFLDQDDVRCIKRFALEDAAAFTELLATDAEARRYPQALLKVLTNITDVRLQQYALTLLAEFLSVDAAARVKFLVRPGSSEKTPFLAPLFQLVGTSGFGARIASVDTDPYVLEYACACACTALAADPSDAVGTSSMLAWVMTHIKQYGSTSPKQVRVTEIAVSGLKKLLRNDFLRRLFAEEQGIERLNLLLTSRNTQVLYDACFCLWTLSLKAEYCSALERAGSVTSVAHLVRTAMPLKLLRVAIGLLVNVSKDPECGDSLAEVADTHVPDTLDALLAADPKISDPELLEDITWLNDAIRSNKRVLTSLERYEKGVLARRFEWTGVHTSDFWKENAMKFEAGDFRLIRAVGEMLRDGTADATTLAVALFDIGEFAVNHPQGRNILHHLGLRPIVMTYLKREDEEIRAQALLAVSKMMLTKWQYVGSSTPSTPAGGDAPAAGASKK